MSFFDAGPEAVEFGAEQIGLVEQHGGVGKQIEDGAVGAGDGGVELPAGENGDAAGADGGFDDFFGVPVMRLPERRVWIAPRR